MGSSPKYFRLKNMLTNKLYILLFCFAFFATSGQRRLEINSQYLMNNYFLISPSYTAPYGTPSKVRLSHRQQWLGLDGAPRTTVLTLQSNYFKNSAIGGYMFKDTNGIYSQIGGQITYAYQIDFKKDASYRHAVSFGLSLNIVQNSVDRTRLYQAVLEDPVLQGKNDEISPDFNFGISYNFRRFFASLAWFNIFTMNQRNESDQKTNNGNMRILASAGYLVYSDEFFNIVPSLLLNYSTQVYSFIDSNVRFNFFEKWFDYWCVLSLRKTLNSNTKLTASSIILGITKDNYHFGYNFEIPLDKIMGYGTHQVMLGIDIDFGNRPKKKKFCGCPG